MTTEETASPRRRRTLLLVSAAGLGVLAVSRSRNVVLPQAIAVRGAGSPWNGDAYLAVGLTVAAVIAGLVLIRWWPWLLLAGSLLTMPAALAPYVDELQSRPTVGHAGLAGLALVLVAILGAAQELVDTGALAAGAALAGCAVGAGLVNAALAGAGWIRLPLRTDLPQLVLTVVAVVGGLAAVILLRAERGRRPGVRVTIAGALAALVAFLPAVITLDRATRLLEVSGDSLARRSYVMVGMLGIATLVVAALAAALAGVRAGAAALAAGAVQAAVAAPMLLGLFGVASHQVFAVVMALAGVAAGAAAGLTRWRAGFAISGTVAGALGLLVLNAATGGTPEKLVTQARWIPAGLLLALLIATVTCTVATAAALTKETGALPAALGPIAGALALGGREALTLTQVEDGRPDSSYLNPAHHMGSSVALLFVVALLVAFLAAIQMLCAQRGKEPAPVA